MNMYFLISIIMYLIVIYFACACFKKIMHPDPLIMQEKDKIKQLEKMKPYLTEKEFREQLGFIMDRMRLLSKNIHSNN